MQMQIVAPSSPLWACHDGLHYTLLRVVCGLILFDCNEGTDTLARLTHAVSTP
jgi:hypothetical protein